MNNIIKFTKKYWKTNLLIGGTVVLYAFIKNNLEKNKFIDNRCIYNKNGKNNKKIYQILSNCPTVMKPGYVPSVFAYNQWINTLCFLIRLRVNAYLYKHNIRRQLIKCPDDNGEVSNCKMFYRFPI